MEKDKSGTKITPLIVIMMLMTLITIATLFMPSLVKGSIERELEYNSVLVGEEEADDIYQQASTGTNLMMYDSGLVETMRETLLPKHYIEGTESSLEKKTFLDSLWLSIDEAIQAVAFNMDLILMRLLMLKIWLAGTGVVLLASILSGYWLREIKKHGFEYSSPMRHGLSRKVIYLMPIILFLYVIAPFSIPSILLPLLLMTLCFAVMSLVANTIKRV